MRNRSGEIIRDYQLLEHVGEGAFASVYRAEHRLLEQIRAIKIIHPQYLTNPEFLQRFKAEAQVVAKLAHPHIVSLFEFWLDEQGAYIVMQWMGGGSLEDLLKKEGRLPLDDISKILAQIAPALNLVHEREIVHRDIKPANILFDDDGDAHLADFGLAKWLRGQSANESGEHTIGTPAYMSPEQADPSLGPRLTPRADIYSLGVILYEMLVGKHPFGEIGIVEMILHHLRDPLPSIRDIRPDLPAKLDQIVQKATAKDPENRYPDAISLAGSFQDAVSPNSAQNFVTRTSSLPQAPVVRIAGDLNARIYAKAGAVLENPRRLVGRDKLAEEVLKLIENNSHILLHGLAGIGKTTLAGAAAARFLAPGNRQVIWVELGRQDAGALFEAVARALGKYSTITGAQDDERIAIMRDMLLEHDALLVVDNIWNERAVLPIIRAVPHSMPMLMTSRIAVSIDGKMLDLGALDATDALALLRYHSQKAFENEEHAVHLCEVLGYHPYAIEMAGKRLQAYQSLTPDRLVRDIHTAPHDLVPTGPLGVEHQRSIKDLLDESIAELPDALRSLLVLLGGLFSSRASLSLLTGITGKSMPDMEADFGELERNGLLQLVMDSEVPAHFRLHDLTYSYAQTIFSNNKQSASNIISGVRHFVKNHVDDYDALEFDLMNILGAARAALHAGDNQNLIEIMRLVVVEASFLVARGTSSQAIELVETAIDRAKAIADYESAHYLAGKLGDAHKNMTRDYDRAMRSYEMSLELARKLQNRSREAILLSVLATTRFMQGHPDAEAAFEQASQAALASGDPNAIALALVQRGHYEGQKQPPDYRKSLHYSNEAAKVAEKHGITKHLCTALINRANCERVLGMLDDALKSDRQAYDIAVELGDKYGQAISTLSIGEDYHAMESRDQAEKYFKQALSLCTALNLNDQANEIREIMKKNNYTALQLSFDKGIGGDHEV